MSRASRLRTAAWYAVPLGIAVLLAPSKPAAAAPPPSGQAQALVPSTEDVRPAAASRPPREGLSVLWVQFINKGRYDAAGLERAIRAAGERVSPRAKARRARETGGRFIPDFQDLPVATSYIRGVRSAGATVRRVSKWLNAVSVDADPFAAARIARLPYVRAVTPVAPVVAASLPAEQNPRAPRPTTRTARGVGLHGSPALERPVDYGPSATQLINVNAIAAHDSGYSGAGVVAGIFDTGFWKGSSALAPLKRIAEWDFAFNDGETENEPEDDPNQWNHGTGIWSVFGGYWPGELIGPAYNASFILAKTRDITLAEPSEEDNWLAAMEWADSIGVDVISNSMVVRFYSSSNYEDWDMDGHTTLITQAALTAARRGIVIASAMGNNGPGALTLWAPSDADSILAVGGTYEDNTIWESSGRGPTWDGRGKPDVVAQAYGVLWALTAWDGTGSYPGTSLATPLVGGVTALVREAHPEWTAQQVRYAIKSTAVRTGSPDSTTYGWGRPDAVKAIYGSTLGPPIYPKPFSLASPADSVTHSLNSATFRWHPSVDLTPGDAVVYEVELRDVGSNTLIWSTTTPDTFAATGVVLSPNSLYEWSATATDLLGHARECREPYRLITETVAAAPVPGGSRGAPRVTLLQNRPNPVHAGTEIEFRLAGTSAAALGPDGTPTGAAAAGNGSVPVSLRIFDSSGRLVRTLLSRQLPESFTAAIRWDGLTEDGRRAAPGVYVYQLRAAGEVHARRLVLLR